ncbi:MAG TPA: substrate-binding domain-containing protein [Deltaproteobacteria bacterium]|nr:substrate-binding domain-containing protein [Deltaproteobacteria bacterium]HPJ94762.1 substrate-binding domain-containing protein [Deltaproteobacteria bacterium]HPR53046.1 substrate-binding domain-containing protein [Deltaproteobacteria bacterium]
MKNLRNFLTLATVLLLLLTGAQAASAADVLKMATTTSTDNTGLLDYLAPKILADTNIELQWVAVGTGKALELGKNCDVDVLLVHAPASEKKYVADGYGVDRRQIMFNDFVIIGPKDDPAGVRGKDINTFFKTVYEKKAKFASRGDNSGTHKKELALWQEATVTVPDKEQWYIQTGQGMINTINIAAERDAYTLTDRGTYIKYEANHKGNPPLVILVEGDASLRNQYSILAVNPDRCKDAKYDLATKLALWFISPEAQKLIGDFKLLDKQLFTPNAGE